MTLTTITGQAALWRVAEATHKVRSSFVTTVASSTVLTCIGQEENANGAYNHALATIPGKGLTTVLDYDGMSKTFTLASPGLSGAAEGDLLMLAWWNPDERARAWAAINRAIEESYPDFWLEREVSAAESGITLSAGQARYALPVDLGELFEIGIVLDGGEPCWLTPADLWRQSGAPGAYELVFRTGLSHGTLADACAGSGLALRYAARAPILANETETTALPLWYFDISAARYREAELNDAAEPDLAPAHTYLPLLQRRATEARARLGTILPRLRERRGPRWEI